MTRFVYRRAVLLAIALSISLTGATAAHADPVEDTIPPNIWVEIGPSQGTGPWVGWYRSPTAATVRASDSTGVAYLYYRLDGAQSGAGSTTSPPARLDTVIGKEGLTTIVIDARDTSGNLAQVKYGVGIDLTDPTAAITGLTDGANLKNGELRRAEFSCGDPGGAIVSCEATNDGAPFTSGSFVTTAKAGPHQLKVTAIDRVGRRSERILDYQVGRRDLRIVSPPVITGNPTSVRIGEQLTVGGAVFDPAPDAFRYEWTAAGQVVALGPAFTPTAEHLGKRVAVVAYGSGSGSQYGETYTPPVGDVLVRPALSPMTVAEQPSIMGDPTTVSPGVVLRASGGAFSPEPEKVTFMWFVDDKLAGTGPTWTPGVEHLGTSVQLMAVATHPDHFDTPSARTPGVRVVPSAPDPGGPGPGGPGPGGPAPGDHAGAAWSLLTTATVEGKPTVGKRLRAVLPQLSGPAQSWTYQWLRGGKPIKGATKKAYQLRKTDRRRKVTVRITATSATGAVIVSTAKPKRIR